MTIHTAAWHVRRAELSCGHALAIREGDEHAWCSWCARTVDVAA